jgi:hypothetical protein
VYNVVDVIPEICERVTDTDTPEVARQVQKSVVHASERVAGLTQESAMSLRVGQHVTVVIVETPRVS